MWYYDISPDATRAAIVDREGYTVADISAPLHSTAAADLERTAHLMASAPLMFDALRALTDAVAQYVPMYRDWPEYCAAHAAIVSATPPLMLHHVHDSGHGWIGIDHAMIDRLGIANEISPYSYRGQTVAWLEEDRDAGILLRALSCAGIKYRIRDEYLEGDAPIRMLPRW